MSTTPRRLLEQVMALSLPLKFLASAALGAIAGSSVLGLLVEYATHSYSLAYGFRPPVEGIPYLQTIVVVGSFTLLVSGAVLAAVMFWLFGKRRATANVTPETHKTSGFRLLGAALLLLALLILFQWLLPTPAKGSALETARNFAFALASSLLGSLVGAAFTALNAWRPTVIWWLSLGTVAMYYSVVIAFLFTPSSYAAFLRHTGFGGGLPVQLQIEQGGDRASVVVSGHLMLRTIGNVVIFSSEKTRFYEYPLARVVHISYPVGGLGTQPSSLP